MPDTFPYSAAPLLALMGVVAYVALSELWLWRGSRQAALHGWAVGLTVAVAAFLVGRFLQRLAIGPGPAILGLKLQYVSGLAIALKAVGLTTASNGKRLSRSWFSAGVASLVTLGGLTLFTPWVVTSEVVPIRNLLGTVQLIPRPGRLVIAVLAVIAVGIATASRELRHAEGAGRQRRRTLRPMAWLCALAAVNDVLFSWGLLHTIPLLEYALTMVALMASFLMDRRAEEEFRTLNQAVDERTTQLRQEQAKLVNALAEVSRTETRFRELAHATLEGIVVHEGGVILDANEAMARLVGCASAELRGRPLVSIFEEASHQKLMPIIREGAQHPVEAELVHTSGTVITVEVVGSNTRRGESEVGVLAIRDIGERKRIQGRLVLADRLASIGRLAAGAAHEINNPLTYVSGNLEAAIEYLASPPSAESQPEVARAELRAILGEALDGCQRVALIMRDLRELARPHDTKLEAVDVREALRMALKMSHNELRFRAQIVEELTAVPLVHGDEKRLGQVFLNILSNAAHAIPDEDSPGGHRILVSVRLDAHDAKRVVVEIADTGLGIPADVLPKVFDPFFTTKAQGKGMGLGLSICHSIITSFGGDITIANRTPRGTVVRIILPVASTTIIAETSGPHALTVAQRPGRILIVDDDLAVARTIARALRKHEVQICGSGDEALQSLAKNRYDVIVCDLMMPGMTGMELFDALEATQPDIQQRMIFVTGGAFTSRASEFLARVPNMRFDKPLDVKRLRVAVDEMVNR